MSRAERSSEKASRRGIGHRQAQGQSRVRYQLAQSDTVTAARPQPSLPTLRFLSRPLPRSYTDAIPRRQGMST